MTARDLVYTFAQIRGQLTQPILDARLLPYPKEVILDAFTTYEAHLVAKCRDDPDAAAELEQVRPVGLRVFDFQTIDPEDMAIVMEINSGVRFKMFREGKFENLTSDQEFNLQIFNSYFQKYFLRAMEEQNIR
jgi:hypothetical protein